MRHTGSTRGPFCVHVFNVLARPVSIVRTEEPDDPYVLNDRIPARPTLFATLRTANLAFKPHPFLFDGFSRDVVGWTSSGPGMHAKAHLADQPCPTSWVNPPEQATLAEGQ